MAKRKPPEVRRRILWRLEAERWQRRLEQKAGKKKRNRAISGSATGGRAVGGRHKILRGRTPSTAAVVTLTVPPKLCLRREHSATCGFVDSVRAAVRAGNKVMLRFNDVTQIRTSALVYLLAQIHKLRLEHGENAISGTYPDSIAVERLLAESGFFRLLNVQTRARVAKPSAKMRYIKFKSDQRLNGKRIAEVREEILGHEFSMPVPIRSKIFRAVSEAMLNVGHHAYRNKSYLSQRAHRFLAGRWWFMASFNVRDNVFSLAFADAGVGIPKTLPRRYPMEMLRKIFSLLPGLSVDDGQMIEAAMVLGRTRTSLDNRGKGLLDLTPLIDIVGGAKMNIYSRKGVVTYTAGRTKHDNLDHSVEGTLIEWVLPLDKTLVAQVHVAENEAEFDN